MLNPFSSVVTRILGVFCALLLTSTLVLGGLLKHEYTHSGLLSSQLAQQVEALKDCGEENKKLRTSTKATDKIVENASQEKSVIQQGTIKVVYQIQHNAGKEVEGACITNVLNARLDPSTDRVLREQYSGVQKRPSPPAK